MFWVYLSRFIYIILADLFVNLVSTKTMYMMGCENDFSHHSPYLSANILSSMGREITFAWHFKKSNK